MWQQEKLQSFQEFLRWYNDKDVVPTLEGMQRRFEFPHNKAFDKLKLGCTIPYLANNCLHNSTCAKFYQITENDKDLFSKIPEDMLGGPLIVFTRKAVVDQILIRKPTIVC